jgi:penicillin-binding protein 1A
MLRKILIGGVAAVAVVALALVAWIAFAIQGLPNHDSLVNYEPPVTTRVHAGDGSLIAEFAREHRVFVPIEKIPDNVKNAFLSAEDKGFYEHGGIDFTGLMRATAVNIASIFTGDRLQGASTITQQVAKNMLLTSDRTITRKVKEAFLAQRIEQALSKDRILELYLNEIFLGQRAYGVAAASLNYFNKSLDQLTLAEAAYLASLPKGPNNYHPVRRKQQATERRNWVLGQMARNGFITQEEADAARAEELVSTDRMSGETYVASAHFVEELRREALAMFKAQGVDAKDGKRQTPEQMLYDGGLSIRATVDTRLQVAASAALRKGLEQYDRRRGWRGPLQRIDLKGDVAAQLAKLDEPPGASGWALAVVTASEGKTVRVRLADGRQGALSPEDVNWAAAGARSKKERALGPGAAIYVQPLKNDRFALRQVPEVQGAIVAMDANTGRVLAMVGGYSFRDSQYNRVTQARRQPGSSFKPVVYSAALDFGLTPATLVMDEPFALQQVDGKIWSPENYTREFYGPTTLRTGLEMSRNAMTVRLAYEMGMDKVFERAKLLGVYDEKVPQCTGADCNGFLSFALGSGETTLMRLVEAYGSFVNGGKKVTPTLIDRIQDRHGKTVFREDRRACQGCMGAWSPGQAAPTLPDDRQQILDPITAYQISSMLEGAVLKGTGTVVKTVGKPLGGKTGTTNDYKDAWFIGFSPDIVAGVWVGFDQPRDLGEGETGGRLAAPIFRDFMAEALKSTPATPFRSPSGIRFVRVDAKTGLLPGIETATIFEEAFRPGTEPVRDAATTPFVYGQNTVIDPKALGDLSSLFKASDELPVAAAPSQGPTAPGVAQPPREQQMDDIY